MMWWAKFSPTVQESAGKKKGQNATGHGNSYLARAVGEAAISAGKTDTLLSATLGEDDRVVVRRHDEDGFLRSCAAPWWRGTRVGQVTGGATARFDGHRDAAGRRDLLGRRGCRGRGGPGCCTTSPLVARRRAGAAGWSGADSEAQ